jgi:hypothetical protein
MKTMFSLALLTLSLGSVSGAAFADEGFNAIQADGVPVCRKLCAPGYHIEPPCQCVANDDSRGIFEPAMCRKLCMPGKHLEEGCVCVDDDPK